MNTWICPECGENLIEEEKNLHVCPVCGYSICVEKNGYSIGMEGKDE